VYVKWIEAAGGRVVPLRYDAPLPELDRLFNSLNGVLFTGGDINISTLDSQYMRAADHLLNRTLEANSAGAHVPLWGTCMGIQTLSVLISRKPSVVQLNAFDSESLMLPLNLTTPQMAKYSRLLRAMPLHILDVLTTKNVTVNLHHDGVPPETFSSDHKLSKFFRVISTNRDRKEHPFVSTIEAFDFPVYAVQWHPERPQFQFSISAGEHRLVHTPEAIQAMQAVANFFVDEARQNSHRFASAEDEAANLIYNYAPTGPEGDSYQAYVFPPASSMVRETRQPSMV
jgi:gamma-glutamyl hydrolase